MEFWNNKRVLITGHSGFKGGWLSKTLKKVGAEIHGISLPGNEEKDFFTLASVAEVMTSDFRIDITNYAELEKALLKIEPEIIFHLAAQPIVGKSYEDPRSTFSTNVMGVVNLLNSVRALSNCKAVVNITTDKVYENRNWFYPYRETDQLGGKDPYSASKACAELVTNSFARSIFDGIGIATARAGNVIGGGDFSEYRLIPDIIRALSNDSEMVIYNPSYVRPWQHVLDPLFGYIRLAELLYSDPVKYSSAYNFSGDVSNVKTVFNVVEICQEFYPNLRIAISSATRTFKEEKTLLLDSSKANHQLGWYGRIDFRQAVMDTMTWYQHFLTNGNVSEFTDLQIDHYWKGLN